METIYRAAFAVSVTVLKFLRKSLNSIYEREPYHDRKQVPDTALSVFMGNKQLFFHNIHP